MAVGIDDIVVDNLLAVERGEGTPEGGAYGTGVLLFSKKKRTGNE